MRAGSLNRFRLVLAGLVATVTAAVAWNIRRPAPEPPVLPTTDNGHKGDQAESVELCRLDGASEEWCLNANQEFGREGGQRDWRGGVVFKTTYMVSGTPEELTIRSERCLFQPKPLEARFEGDAKVTTGRGVEIQTDSILYRGDEESAASDGRVVFRRKSLSGAATGLRYDAREGRMELTADVSLTVDDPLRGPLHIAGRRAIFNGVDDQWELMDDVVVEQSSTRLTADRLIAEFDALEGRLAGLLALSDVDVISDGAILRSAGIIGAPSGSYRLRSPRLKVSMHEDGSPAEVLAGPGGAQVTIIPSKGRPQEQRRIDANGFVAFRLDPQGRIEEVEARKDVVYQVEWHEPQVKDDENARQRLQCKWMVVRMNPETGEIREGEFDRQVVFEDRGRRAKARNARFKNSMLHFLGKPELRDLDGSHLQARKIAVGTGEMAGNLWAMGNVRHVARAAASRKEEGLLGADGMKITAEAFDYDSRQRQARYQGGTRLISGSDEIVAPEVVLAGERPRRRIRAVGGVLTRFRDHASADEKERVIVRAREMTYEEVDARVIYKGTVKFRREGFVTRTPEVLFMDLDPRGALSRVTVKGDEVSVEHNDRTVRGRNVVYSPQEAMLVIRGDPVILRDPHNESRGPVLRLDLKTDRIVMDGLNVQRTASKVRSGSAKKASSLGAPRKCSPASKDDEDCPE